MEMGQPQLQNPGRGSHSPRNALLKEAGTSTSKKCYRFFWTGPLQAEGLSCPHTPRHPGALDRFAYLAPRYFLNFTTAAADSSSPSSRLKLSLCYKAIPVEAVTMATLYPSLEDMKAQGAAAPRSPAPPPAVAPAPEAPPEEKSEPPKAADPPVLYPNLGELNDYMGLSLSSEEVQRNLALVPAGGNAMVSASSAPGGMVAPVTGSNPGMHRAEIKPGLREIHLCKDERGKTGLRLRNIDKGLFVQLVKANSPAALVGLRFGDQVLQIDGKDCAGWNTEKARRVLKKASPEKIVMVVRDRPFQRTVTLHKDSDGHVGFVLKRGQISSLARGSSAARNGLLINHYICEVNGQNVIGLKVRKTLPGEG
ncbi:hypothetical protein lerEdw1_004645, partial [Lerista edwardsae]